MLSQEDQRFAIDDAEELDKPIQEIDDCHLKHWKEHTASHPYIRRFISDKRYCVELSLSNLWTIKNPDGDVIRGPATESTIGPHGVNSALNWAETVEHIDSAPPAPKIKIDFRRNFDDYKFGPKIKELIEDGYIDKGY